MSKIICNRLAAGVTISLLCLGACQTTQPEKVEEIPVSITPPPQKTCMPMSALERVVIPAETETYYGITEIENPPYEPITRKQEMTRVVVPEQVMYVDTEGREVTDICALPEDS